MELVHAMHDAGYAIIFLTGRMERDISLEWLCRHTQIGRENIDRRLFARKKGDFRKDHVVKLELYRDAIEPNYDVLFAVDDKKTIADLWRSIGIPALLCSDWEEKQLADNNEELKRVLTQQKQT